MKHIWDHHTIGVASTNCYVFGNPKEAIMLDPGGKEAVQIARNLSERGIEIKHVLVSHGHFDHLGWAAEVQKLVEGAHVYLHEDEKPNYEVFLDSITRYGLEPVTIREPDRWITDKQLLNLSDYKFKVIHTPGHSPGSSMFKTVAIPQEGYLDYIPLQESRSVFVGDCIFEGAIGRVDLPYSSPEDMEISLNKAMELIHEDSHLYPGHGNDTTMKRELSNNPYLLALQKGIPIF